MKILRIPSTPIECRRWRLARTVLLWLAMIAAGCYCYPFGMPPEQGPPKDSPQDCPVHHAKMEWTRVKTLNIDISWPIEYWLARQAYPYAMEESYSGGYHGPVLPDRVGNLKGPLVRRIRRRKGALRYYEEWKPVCLKCTEVKNRLDEAANIANKKANALRATPPQATPQP